MKDLCLFYVNYLMEVNQKNPECSGLFITKNCLPISQQNIP